MKRANPSNHGESWRRFIGRSLMLVTVALAVSAGLHAQKENVLINKGNQYYKLKKFDESQEAYQKAIGDAPTNPTANYNLGDAQFRKNSFEDASKSFDVSVGHAADKNVKEKGYYNKGVALIKQQKTDESIDAWKNALKLDPNDEDARENLEKALLEKKSRQPKDQKQNQQQNKQNQQQKQQQPPHSKLNKQQVDQLLRALQQRENEAQQKMNQNKPHALSQPDKDW
ncbi:MAG TPA: tetratricopeptide repeat protein [Puia sp.]|nr:tetratricopeptide repeat protein [Puia sp.]